MNSLRRGVCWLMPYWLMAIVLVVGAQILGSTTDGWVWVTLDNNPIEYIDVRTEIEVTIPLQFIRGGRVFDVSPRCGLAYFNYEMVGESTVRTRMTDGTIYDSVALPDVNSPSYMNWHFHEGLIVFARGMHDTGISWVSPFGGAAQITDNSLFALSNDQRELIVFEWKVIEPKPEEWRAVYFLHRLDRLTGIATTHEIAAPIEYLDSIFGVFGGAKWSWWAGDDLAYGTINGRDFHILDFRVPSIRPITLSIPESKGWLDKESRYHFSATHHHLAFSAIVKDERNKPLASPVYLVSVPALEPTFLVEGVIGGLEFSPDSKQLAVLVSNTLQIWDVASQHIIDQITLPISAETSVYLESWSPSGRYLLMRLEQEYPKPQLLYIYDLRRQWSYTWGREYYYGWIPDRDVFYSGGTFIDLQSGEPQIIRQFDKSGELCQW